MGILVIVGRHGCRSRSYRRGGCCDRSRSALARKADIVLAPVDAVQDMVPHQADIDPFLISDAEKISVLAEATRAMMVPFVVLARGQMQFLKERKTFASSEGTCVIQDRIESGAGISAMAASDRGGVQVRSYPMSLSGDNAQAGWEFIEGMNFLEHAEPTAREAVALLSARSCPSCPGSGCWWTTAGIAGT